MNEKSNFIAKLLLELQIKYGKDVGEEITGTIIEAIANYDLVRTTAELVVYDKIDENLIARFFMGKTAIGLSPKTIKAYKQTLSAFMSRIRKHIKDITPEDIRLYLAYMRNLGNTSTSLNNIRRNLSSFFTYLHNEGLIDNNPSKKIYKIREERRVKEPFTEQEVELIRNHAKNLRDKALIDFLISTGCRVSEVAGANRDEIDWKENRILIKGKGNKFRWVYLNARALVSLKLYLESRNDTCESLFVSRRHSKMIRFGASGIARLLREYGKQLGIPNVHAHRFRRTCATLALRRGMPIEQVAKILGHSSLNTTTIYANSTQDDLAIAHRRYLS